MKTRRKAREASLQVLYHCDLTDTWSSESVDFCLNAFHPTNKKNKSDIENRAFSKNLIQGVTNKLDFLDSNISRASTRWNLDRMATVDRNIIRMATFEIAFINDIPTNVSINEAIELAKLYGAEESPMFVNGILDKIATDFASNPNLITKVA